jgi:tetratricopeptide (TPR) repeat protein
VVAHQPRDGADWIQLYDDLPATSACVWTLPPADAESHKLRVSLFHQGSLLGQDSPGPFTIAGSATPPRIEPQVVAINENSLYYSERAELQLEKYRTSRAQHQKWFAEIAKGLRRDAQGVLAPQELEKIPPEMRRQAAERDRALAEAAEKIRENFQKALELDPKNYRATYGMAQLLHRTAPERADEAIRHLERTVEIKADHAAALNDLGASHILRGDYAAAEASLRSALAVEDLGSYHYNLALALFHQKKTVEARRHFEEALAKGGSAVKSGEVYYYIVSAFLEEGEREEARRRLDLYGQQIPPSLRESLDAAVKGSQ